MNEIDEEETKKEGKPVYKKIELEGHMNLSAGVSKLVPQSGEKVRGKPAKRIEHRIGPESSHSMIIIRRPERTITLQIAWKKDGTMEHLDCKTCDINWHLADTADYSDKFEVTGTTITCKACGASGTYDSV